MGSVQEKFALIQQASADSAADFTITELCNIYGVSRSSYYSWLSAEEVRASREAKDRADFELILSAYLEGGRKKGAKAIHMTLLHRPEPVVMNLKKIRHLMKKYGPECPIRKANPYRRMAKALKTNNVADNLVQRQFEQYGPRMILLTDIIYIPYNGKHAYLSTILDAYIKQILAYSISDNLQVDFVLDNVRKHLKNSKLRQSMPHTESFFSHMKDEISLTLRKERPTRKSGSYSTARLTTITTGDISRSLPSFHLMIL